MSVRRAGRPPPRRGLGAIAAIGVLVLLAGIVAGVLAQAGLGANASAQVTDAARAHSAAAAGIEWGLHEVFQGSWGACSGQSHALDLRADTGMRVSVTCTSATYVDGESAPGVPRTLRVTTLDAVACNAASCPDATAVARRGYVERRRVATTVDEM